jgi:O-antigen ligase
MAIPTDWPAFRREFPDIDLVRALLASLPALLYLAPLAAAWMLPLLALAVLWCAHREGALAPAAALAAGWMWYPLLAVMALSSLWALDGTAAILLAIRLALLIVSGILVVVSCGRLAAPVVETFAVALGWGMIVAGVAVAADLLTGTPFLRLLHFTAQVPLADAYSRGAVFQGIAAVPLGLALWRQGSRSLAVGQGAASAAAVLLGLQMAAKLALLVGVLGGGAVLLLPLLRWLVPVGVIGFGLALPLLLPYQPDSDTTCWLALHKPSGLHRLLIWNWVDQRIRERPVLGWGLDAARRMPGGTEHVVIRRCDAPESRPQLDNEILPLHPHNAALQIWLELGLAGAAASALGVGASSLRMFRRSAGQGMAEAAAMLASGASVAFLSFGIWQEWWVAVLALTAAVASFARADPMLR